MDLGPTPRVVSVPESLGLYFRVGRNDQSDLLKILSEDVSGFSGLVIDARLAAQQRSLRLELKNRRMESILDTRAMELALPGSLDTSLGKLKWAGSYPHTIAQLSGFAGTQLIESIAEFAIDHGFSAILSPTHYLSTPNLNWLDLDLHLTRKLRLALDKKGGKAIRINYSLCAHSHIFFDDEVRHDITAALNGSPIDAIWLRVHPFGSDKGQQSLRNYIDAAKDLHRLKVPVIGEKTGSVGLPLMAFGAVGGIESGVTLGERFDISNWLKQRTPGVPFQHHPRIYVPQIYSLLNKAKAEALLANGPAKAKFGCKDRSCCRHAIRDMFDDPKRHYLYTRIKEVDAIARMPRTVRAYEYLEHRVKPATELLAALAQKNKDFDVQRRRVEGWRRALAKIVEQQQQNGSFAASPSKPVHLRLVTPPPRS